MAHLVGPRPPFRERYSSLLMVPAPGRIDECWSRTSGRRPSTPLAEPPAGSGLKPVPGDRGLPLIGHMLDGIRFGLDWSLQRYERLGPVAWIGYFGRKVVMVGGPPATQALLANKDKAFSQDGWVAVIDKFFHRGLMLMSFDEHHMHRRIMQEAFTRPRLTAYVDRVSPVARAGVADWPSGSPTRVYPLLKELTLDIATQVFMGGHGGEDAAAINQAFVDTVRAPTGLLRAPIPGSRWKKGLDGRVVLETYFRRHLPAARAHHGDDLFSALCHARTEDGEAFSDEDIVSHMIFLMMAAHDTTTITTTAVAYYLAKHPEWQQRARSESLALGDELPDIAALEGLSALDLVMKEALRLVAPVPGLIRMTVKDTEIEGYYIPKGTLVSGNPVSNHYDPNYWTDPHTFDPERFNDARREDKSHRNAWIPFGGGAHKCIGLMFGTLEVKAILHELLLRYNWSVPPDYEVRWDGTSLPIPVDGLPITFRIR